LIGDPLVGRLAREVRSCPCREQRDRRSGNALRNVAF
jgi:hypothetical protein